MTLGEIAAQATTYDKSELTNFAYISLRFVVHPRALQPPQGLHTTRRKLVLMYRP